MIYRCNDTKTYNSAKYIQRGIKVFEPWIDDFQLFSDYVTRLPHFGEPGYSLDRIDNDGNYEPGNIRWANAITQANNRTTNVRITYAGESHTVAEWARLLGMPYSKLQWRLYSGWPIEKAFQVD